MSLRRDSDTFGTPENRLFIWRFVCDSLSTFVVEHVDATSYSSVAMTSVRVPAKDAKLIPHRWAMHAIQALAQRDHELLRRVFTELRELPPNAIDTQVKAFGCGAPMQFHDYGFFDERSRAYGTSLFEKVVQGDTLLLIAMRHQDPQSAGALVKAQASLVIPNSQGEKPIEILFDAFAALQLHKRCEQDEPQATGTRKTPAGSPLEPLLTQQGQYHILFAMIEDQLQQHHTQLQDHVEAELYRIYSTCAPERLSKIGAQMTEFEYRESILLASVKRKYETQD